MYVYVQVHMYVCMYVTYEVLTVLIHTTAILFSYHVEVNFPLECYDGWINTAGSVTNQGQ